MNLTKEEREILASVERGEFRRIDRFQEEKRRYEAAADTTARRDARVSIRISARDLRQLQQQADLEGIPYQTLISSILHKYVAGSLR